MRIGIVEQVLKDLIILIINFAKAEVDFFSLIGIFKKKISGFP